MIYVFNAVVLTSCFIGTTIADGRPKYFQSPHKNATVPADYPHQDEAFANKQVAPSGRNSQGDNFPREKNHNIFLRDRVVRSICKALATFVSTGVPPVGRVKDKSNAKTGPCGWWKSAACPPGEGDCGFEWKTCADVEPMLQAPQEPDYNAAGASRSRGKLSVPGDESELNLQLPTSAEWQRRQAAMANATKDDD